MEKNKVEYSVILPCYNEADSLVELSDRLVNVFSTYGKEYELIFIDDGSTDHTFEILEQIKIKYGERIRVLRLSRNFGHHFAITAGLDKCLGNTAVIMDTDLQMMPEEIPKLINRLNEGYDIVYGFWENRNDAFSKKMLSKLFVKTINRMTRLPVPLNSYIFRAINRKCINSLKELREQSRFITGLSSWIGFRQTGVSVSLGKRKYGSPKYNFFKSLELGLRTIAAFTHFPLQLIWYLGIVILFIALIFSFGLLLGMININNGFLINLMIYFQGVNFVIWGLMGEYIGRILYETQQRPLYIISEEL